jgi:hypothetical protein
VSCTASFSRPAITNVKAAFRVEPCGPVVGDARRPVAEIDALQVEAPEQRRCVDQLQRKVWRLSVDPIVVEGQHVGVTFLVEVEERQVPVVMVREPIVRRPVALARLEPRYAFVDPTLHLHDVGAGVHGPRVPRLDVQSPAGSVFRFGVLIAFFQTEGVHAEKVGVSGHILRPVRQ